MHRGVPSRILILGDGILGKELHTRSGWDILSRKQNGFDITESSRFIDYFVDVQEGMAACRKYDAIVNCIANTDTYSSDKAKHWDVNFKGVANLVDFCNSWDIKMIHISTDYVYTNSMDEASEDDVPIHGNNWYSYTKLLADAYIELKSKNYLICRGTHKPYPFPHNKAWINQIGNFDYVNVIAFIIIELITGKQSGIYNVGTAVKTMKDLAMQTNTNITPAIANDRYPTNVTMNLSKLNKVLHK